LRRRKRNACRILVAEREGKRQLGRHKHRLEVNIKTDLRDVGWGGMDWIDLAQDRGQVAGSCEYDNEPSGFIKCWQFLSS
jgi:hypothetical protein